MENQSSIGNAPRKGLSDITNLQQQPIVVSQGAKLLLQPASLRSKDYIGNLQKENMMLMKVLADRNQVIELSGIELQKLRTNLEKFQQQNLLLAQANSQMLAELNSGKDRLKALKHELGCKNAVLKAIKTEEKAQNKACLTSENEVRTNKCDEEGESHKVEDGEDETCNMNRCNKAGESLIEEDGENKPCNRNRRRQSKSLCPNIKPVQAKEPVDNKRVCLRRQSTRFKAQKPELTEDAFVDDTKFLVSSSCDDKVHESGLSDSSVKKEHEEGSTNNKRVCLRRQSARFKTQEPELTEDVFDVDDTAFLISSCDDKVDESGPTSSHSLVKKEHEEGSITPRNEAQELRRISVGRPLRRAVEKVQSYKEIPVNVKMRRIE
ncbi:SHUGOSHIN 2 isoform X2 [Herrania umbratica]|uniref:SHUGOSHIN 2 isoform X2 n=1 Tax=Herrania umbratica TaxID=108875 RepID=A0A6J1B8Z3_9ROSI|nr:SHUGOSHIN 2 isoform X2 [Herrania umbratica]